MTRVWCLAVEAQCVRVTGRPNLAAWSRDAKWLLVDDQATNSWNLLRVPRQKSQRIAIRRTARLGGTPLWCCPENHYAGS